LPTLINFHVSIRFKVNNSNSDEFKFSFFVRKCSATFLLISSHGSQLIKIRPNYCWLHFHIFLWWHFLGENICMCDSYGLNKSNKKYLLFCYLHLWFVTVNWSLFQRCIRTVLIQGSRTQSDSLAAWDIKLDLAGCIEKYFLC